MKSILIFLYFIAECNIAKPQDSLMISKQKGVLILAEYNHLYDHNIDSYQKPIDVVDYFFPVSEISFSLLTNPNVELLIKSSYRVEYFSQRQSLKLMGSKIKCVDSTYCYPHKLIYVIPVEISFKMSNIQFPIPCDKTTQSLRIENGALLKYEVDHKAITVTRIKKIGK